MNCFWMNLVCNSNLSLILSFSLFFTIFLWIWTVRPMLTVRVGHEFVRFCILQTLPLRISSSITFTEDMHEKSDTRALRHCIGNELKIIWPTTPFWKLNLAYKKCLSCISVNSNALFLVILVALLFKRKEVTFSTMSCSVFTSAEIKLGRTPRIQFKWHIYV